MIEPYYRYSFLLKHDNGKFFVSVISYSRKSAEIMLMKMENCPKRAIEFIRKERVVI